MLYKLKRILQLLLLIKTLRPKTIKANLYPGKVNGWYSADKISFIECLR